MVLALLVNHYRDNAITYRDQRDVVALDEKYTEELTDANAENTALQRKLDVGGRVLVKGKCPVPATTDTASAK